MSFMLKRQEPADRVASDEIDGEIREFVRRDLAPWRRRPSEMSLPAEAAAEPPSQNVGYLVQRVALASMNEIDNVISEMQNLREILRNEGERVQGEIASYANLNQTALSSMKIISESMYRWRAAMERKAFDRNQ